MREMAKKLAVLEAGRALKVVEHEGSDKRDLSIIKGTQIDELRL